MARTGHIFIVLLLAISWAWPQEAVAATKQPTSKTSASKSTAKSTSVSKAKSKSGKALASRAAKKKTASKSRGANPPYSALVVDADTGRVLYEQNAGGIRYPASLTKMMTLYMTFDALKKGKLHMEQTLPVSAKAAEQPQTNISLNPGDRLPVRTAIESLVVRSANDSAVVIAEALGDTVWNFSLLMTKKARELGMKNTVFRNPSGLPDNQQYTTAFDMARLGIALRRDFPEYYHYFSLQSFEFRGITYPGHNRVMEKYPGADGIKTGYIRASGFNLVTSVSRDGHNLVAVVIGGTSASRRDEQMVAMLDNTFAQIDSKKNSVAMLENGDEPAETQEISQGSTDLVTPVALVSAQGY